MTIGTALAFILTAIILPLALVGVTLLEQRMPAPQHQHIPEPGHLPLPAGNPFNPRGQDHR